MSEGQDKLEPILLSEEDYFNKRLVDQMNWYDRKSSQQQKRFKRYRAIEIILGALIPFLLSFSLPFKIGDQPMDAINIIVGAIGVAIVVLGGMLGLHKYEENYLQYRRYAEMLKSEKYLYQTRSYPYNAKNRFKLFVSRVEKLLGEEQEVWQEAYKRVDEEEDGNIDLPTTTYPAQTSIVQEKGPLPSQEHLPTPIPEPAPTPVSKAKSTVASSSALAEEEDGPPDIFG